MNSDLIKNILGVTFFAVMLIGAIYYKIYDKEKREYLAKEKRLFTCVGNFDNGRDFKFRTTPRDLREYDSGKGTLSVIDYKSGAIYDLDMELFTSWKCD